MISYINCKWYWPIEEMKFLLKHSMSFCFDSCHMENNAACFPMGTEMGFTNLASDGYSMLSKEVVISKGFHS